MNLKIPKMRVVGFLFQSDPMEIKNFCGRLGKQHRTMAKAKQIKYERI